MRLVLSFVLLAALGGGFSRVQADDPNEKVRGLNGQWYQLDSTAGVYRPIDKPCTCDDCKCDTGKCPRTCPVTANTDTTAISLRLPGGAIEALAEVNAARATAGLPPLISDPDLAIGAAGAATYRARLKLFGHTGNDFAFLPAGARACAGGCAAYPSELGWRSCCTYEGYTHGGAAYAIGDDGKRYMHLFVDIRPTELPNPGVSTTPIKTCGSCTNGTCPLTQPAPAPAGRVFRFRRG